MTSGEIQGQIFKAIKTRAGENQLVADEIAKLLDISTDSAYRRMRGEKTISLDELHILCSHYKISLDKLMNVDTGVLLFEGNFIDYQNFHFDAYLKGISHQLAYMNSFNKKEFFYLCKDSPIFHHFYFRDFAAFKHYFWMSTLLYFPEFRNKKINLESYPDEYFEIGKTILDLYDQLDSVEIWNIENLNGTLRQIDYYQQCGLFYSDNDILKVYEAIEKMMDHLLKQAELGYKFKYNDPDRKPMGKYRMYFNEVVLGDNQMLVVVDDSKIAYVPHSAANYMITRDDVYCDKFHNYLQNLMRRSTLISEVSEKERSKFFRIIKDKINSRKEKLKL